MVFQYYRFHIKQHLDGYTDLFTLKIIIWKAQGVPQLNNVVHPKHPEEEETSPNKNHIITGKQQQTN